MRRSSARRCRRSDLDYDHFEGRCVDDAPADRPARLRDNRRSPLTAYTNGVICASSLICDSGGRLVMWHGWYDELIPPEGSIDYH